MDEIKNAKCIKYRKIIILIILIITILVFAIIFNKKINNTEKQAEILKSNNMNIGLIDMNNFENVKINGNKKENISKEILKSREIEEGITLTSIRLYAEDGVSNFLANVTNEKKIDFESKVVMIKFSDYSGNVYAEMQVSIPPIKKGGQASINAKTTKDIVNAYDFKIE